jgi:MoaA/NifB/PqqE/SkfB family radical SAM enzyme
MSLLPLSPVLPLANDDRLPLNDNQSRMRRYFEIIEQDQASTTVADPVCLYLETTNRCNLSCVTCPRTFEQLEPERDMPWELFTSIVGQFPKVERVVLHGIGEPMLVKDIAERVRYLKERNIYVLFNTNGTLLTESNSRELIAAGLDELRVSLDAATAPVFKMIRGKDMFDRIVKNVGAFVRLQKEMKVALPRVSIWLTGLRETVSELESFVRLAHRLGVAEVYLQRLVFFNDSANGLAREESALFEHTSHQEESLIRRAEEVAVELGIAFSASGATEPGTSIRKKKEDSPWSLCRRPWSLMYITANGRALPCCIAPFSMRGYQSFTLGDATQSTLREIWNGPEYKDFRAGLMSPNPPVACASCGLRWSL